MILSVALTLLIGFMVGILISLASLNERSKFYLTGQAIKATCEENLPRKQVCVLTITAKVKESP